MPTFRPAALGLPLVLALVACVPVPEPAPPSVFDLKPPLVLEAGPVDERSIVLRFDEEIRAVEGSYSFGPAGKPGEVLDAGTSSAASGTETQAPRPTAQGSELRLDLEQDQVAGKDYALAGEVVDARGNGSRFLLGFAGWNGHPARLRITEVQTSKNTSISHPHRDFVEFEVLEAGNLGGMEFSASSTVKTVAWRFPGAEVAKGEILVLHCSPEGLAEEKDESGTDLLASGGIDSSAARDFWSKAGALPDATGVLMLYEAPGGRLVDGLFYADGSKSGPLGDDRVGGLVEDLIDFGLWEAAGTPAWEDAFAWKPSSARSILRLGAAGSGPGAGEWASSATSAQSPGTLDAAP